MRFFTSTQIFVKDPDVMFMWVGMDNQGEPSISNDYIIIESHLNYIKQK
jgi:hypothetical protein